MKIKRCLADGGVIAFPTETVCALSCDATNEAAIKKIYHIKERDFGKVFAIFVKNIAEIERYAIVNEQVCQLINKFSPGPITYVLKAKIPSLLCKCLLQSGKIGIRIPHHEVANDILNGYKYPLVATSINLSGKNSITNIVDIPPKIKDQIDLVISGKEPELKQESTVIDLSDPSKVKILREGCISKEEINAIIAVL